MTQLEQAARLALEALEVATTPLAKDRQEVLRARDALRAALEQPAQDEPLCPRQIKDVLRATGYVTNSQAWELAEEVTKLLAAHGIGEKK